MYMSIYIYTRIHKYILSSSINISSFIYINMCRSEGKTKILSLSCLFSFSTPGTLSMRYAHLLLRISRWLWSLGASVLQLRDFLSLKISLQKPNCVAVDTSNHPLYLHTVHPKHYTLDSFPFISIPKFSGVAVVVTLTPLMSSFARS